MSRVPGRVAGFTIVETLIFLTVSGALLMSAIIMVSGQQRRTEFNQGIREIESRLNDVINDVATGYYERTAPFNCSVIGPGQPTITTVAPNQQGTNAGCLFLGRVVQFATNGDKTQYTTYTVAGRQKADTNPPRDVQNLAEAAVIALEKSSTNNVPQLAVTKTLPFGITLEKICYSTASCSNSEATAFGIFSTLSSSSGSQQLGTMQFDTLVIPGTPVSKPDMVDEINSINDSTPKNPDNGVILCFKSGGTDQHGKITIGAANQQGIKLEIVGGSC